MATQFSDLDALSLELAEQISIALSAGIAARGNASLIVSGGKSPTRMFELLRRRPLDWSRVSVALADERWVEPSDPSSNEKLVRDVLLKDKAAAAKFNGLKNAAPTPDIGAVAAWETFARVPRPFDMVVLNKMSRLHLCLDVMRYVPGILAEGAALIAYCSEMLDAHERYIREHFDDLPEIKNWVWSVA